MSKLYTIDKILVYVGNDKNQLVEMMELFLETIPNEFVKLGEAINLKNWTKAYEISHRIKPSIEILDIKNTVEEFSELHTKLHQKTDKESLTKLYFAILKQVNKAVEQIKVDYNL